MSTVKPSDFEMGIDKPTQKQIDSYVSYTKEAVMRYRVESLNAILNNSGILVQMIKHHRQNQVPRLQILEQYYLANNAYILAGSRRQEKDKSDHRIRHAWAAIISDFLNSHVLSNPVKITSENKKYLELIEEFNHANDVDAHNIELGKDQNNFGRAYELLQRTKEDKDKIYRLEPTETFMIYDTTVRARVLAACRYYPVSTWEDGSQEKHRVELYTHDKIYSYVPVTLDQSTKLELDGGEGAPHAFDGVPIIEYRSDRHRMSVYEKQLPLIDAYDAAQSDTANYMTDFNDAILVLEGRIENADNADYMAKMKDANMLVLVPESDADGSSRGPIKAHYLTKSYDVQGVEAYKTRLKQDIFNTASTPDLSDEAFAGQQSGEALKYKMFGLQQKRNDKEKFFAKGLRIRYKLLENLKRAVHEFSGEEADLEFSFTPNLPKAYLEELKAFVEAGGELSNETKVGLLSFIDDATAEMEKLDEEKKETRQGFNNHLGFGDDHEHSEES